MICVHCNHVFMGGAFTRSSGRGKSVAMRRCPKCEREFVAPFRARAPGKIVALQDENAALRATVARLERVIKEYAHHRSKCNSLYYHADGNAYCDCGFDAALSPTASAAEKLSGVQSDAATEEK